jgi:hypothetical protein
VVSVSPLMPMLAFRNGASGTASVVRLITPPPNSPGKFGE